MIDCRTVVAPTSTVQWSTVSHPSLAPKGRFLPENCTAHAMLEWNRVRCVLEQFLVLIASGSCLCRASSLFFFLSFLQRLANVPGGCPAGHQGAVPDAKCGHDVAYGTPMSMTAR